ncbi:hypothetical protein MPSEU_000584900 [Mayamaea pseudoterrestris]|nr:hypothetical protein MPSEU_000584900 [Mayamaea pseudoterrestris]
MTDRYYNCRVTRFPISALGSLALVVLMLPIHPSTCFSTNPSRHDRNHFNNINSQSSTTPNHIAFICDGNSRWADSRRLPTAAGHLAGAKRLVELLQHLQNLQPHVAYCTMYAFSTENWQRPQTEIDEILSVMEATANNCLELVRRSNICFKVIGNLQDDRLPNSLVAALQKLESESQRETNFEQHCLHLSIAVNHGGRQDILQASKELARLIADGTIDDNADSVTEEDFSKLLSTNSMPDPDLVIRTSGECRLSNFMLWNVAYAELYFTDKYWPDFDHNELQKALEWYASRKRRFGARVVGAAAASSSKTNVNG